MIKKLIKNLKKLVKKINKRMVAKIHKLTQPTRPRKKIGRPLGAQDKVKRKSSRLSTLTDGVTRQIIGKDGVVTTYRQERM